MPITFLHADQLPYPRPSNLVLIDCKAVLSSDSARLAADNGGEEGLLLEVINGLAPSGGRPCTAETFLPGKSSASEEQCTPPRRVALCALPEVCSRHNSPPQPHAIADCARSMGGGGNVAILMCLKDPSYAFAAGCAVARAFPLYGLMSRKRPADKVSAVIPQPDKHVTVFLRVPGEEAWKNVRTDLTAAADGIRLAARLVDTPPNFLHTSAFVAEAMSVVDTLNHLSQVHEQGTDAVTATVLRGKVLADQGFGGLYGVGKAAVEPPALVVLSHKLAQSQSGGERASARAVVGCHGSVCFVGKGIIYDTGGLSIKTKTGMPGMKRDMGGAAAILAAFQAAVKVRIAATAENGTLLRRGFHTVHAILCLAENSVDATATRPDDVHTLYSGRTVEINNTDAEGRLVLSDGVTYATRHLNPAVIIDMATLTGAQGVATGRRHGAVLSNDEGLERMAVACGRSTGDLVHPVVYCPEFFADEFRSSVADMKNSVADRSNAQVSCAGQFIANHMEDFVAGPTAGGGRWLHVDMASPAYQGERATGYGVAILFSLLRELDQEQQEERHLSP